MRLLSFLLALVLWWPCQAMLPPTPRTLSASSSDARFVVVITPTITVEGVIRPSIVQIFQRSAEGSVYQSLRKFPISMRSLIHPREIAVSNQGELLALGHWCCAAMYERPDVFAWLLSAKGKELKSWQFSELYSEVEIARFQRMESDVYWQKVGLFLFNDKVFFGDSLGNTLELNFADRTLKISEQRLFEPVAPLQNTILSSPAALTAAVGMIGGFALAFALFRLRRSKSTRQD